MRGANRQLPRDSFHCQECKTRPFPVPPVCTDQWDEAAWHKHITGREPDPERDGGRVT